MVQEKGASQESEYKGNQTAFRGLNTQCTREDRD